MRIFIILITLILTTSCAHKVVTENKVEIVKNNRSKPSIPVTVVGFEDRSYSYGNQITQCDDGYLFFLIKEPFNGLNKLKDFYDNTLILNQDMNRLIEISVKTRKGVMAIEDYVEESTAINVEITDINNGIESSLKEYVKIEYATQSYYPVCEEKLKSLLLTKKLDPNQDGCELEQQQSYILDPYAFKNAVNDAIKIELTLHDYLNRLYRIIYDEIQQKITLEEAQKQFIETTEELKESKIQEKSIEAMNTVISTFKSTMTVKEQCEASSKKK